ncbi:SLC13 family permease [Anaerobium acetethylicum]|uniref:Na+/H+ antiporter NhaD n=1 Tax=Anaerobium acetethylicum TaxID=1619234 RepID=A0A1D3TQ07_9FIRM|nr:SLC13 family permease [Anaerobium acetethylicum]SCP95580.1 Na+/H+ antiporter NhaD [Anaerobium acetethylicum]
MNEYTTKNIQNKIAEFVKKETVLCIAAALAAVSAVIVPPSRAYLGYIDFRVLALLFCLMVAVAGFQSVGLFEFLAEKLFEGIANLRQLVSILVFLCFFTSMFVTNDVALITFVPFAIMILTMAGHEDRMIFVIVLQTLAANLGSMFTPIGNPQNLYIFAVSKMSVWNFLKTMAPATLVAFALLAGTILFVKREPIKIMKRHRGRIEGRRRLAGYVILFLLCIGTVVHLVDYRVMTAIVVAAAFFMDRNLIKKADYSLLLTFAAFFIFVENIGSIDAVNHALKQMVEGRVLISGLIISQGISNVPAAILLSDFTSDYKDLLLGVNIGGLGTLIASMASLISYKLYSGTRGADRKKYLGMFTGLNVVYLLFFMIVI